MKKYFFSRCLVLPIAFVIICSCASGSPPNSISKNETNLTPGMITTTLKKGESTKSKVMEFFGPPDLVTHENNIEMWGYDKISRESAYKGFGAGIGGGGLPGAGLIAGGIGYKQGQSSETTKTVFLLLYFKDDILIDYKLSVTKF